MWSLIGSTFPLFLIAAPLAIAVLVYAYRRGGRGRETVVSTLLFLRELSRPVRTPSRFWPPLRFFLELLIVAALVAAAAGVTLRDDEARLVLLLDNSLSMRARVEAGIGTETLFERAKEESRKALANLPLGAEVALYVTSPSLRAVSEGFTSASQAKSLLEQQTATFGKDQLRSALQRVTTSSGDTRVVVVSDRRVKASSSDSSLRGVLVGPGIDTLANVSIESVSFQQLDSEKVTIVVRVGYYAPPEHAERIAVKVSLRAGESSLADQRVEIVKNQSSAVTFIELGIGQEVIEARVAVDRPGAVFETDRIPEDNFAWIEPHQARGSVLLVSDLSPKELGLGRITRGSFEVETLEQYLSRSVQPEHVKERRAVVFHRVVPPVPPLVPTLWVNPQGDETTFSIERIAKDTAITGWLQGHPLTSYLNFSVVKFREQAVLSIPGWAQEVVRTTAGPAVVAGELQERRVAVVGFELFPFEGKRSPFLSILFLNLLQWLGGGDSFESSIPVYSSMIIPQEISKARLRSGESMEISEARASTGEAKRELVPNRPGILELFDQNGAVREQHAINVFDREESNLPGQTPIEWMGTHQTLDVAQERVLVEDLSKLAILLLIADIVWWIVSRLRKGKHGVRPRSS